jgi:hypothetical protein
MKPMPALHRPFLQFIARLLLLANLAWLASASLLWGGQLTAVMAERLLLGCAVAGAAASMAAAGVGAGAWAIGAGTVKGSAQALPPCGAGHLELRRRVGPRRPRTRSAPTP